MARGSARGAPLVILDTARHEVALVHVVLRHDASLSFAVQFQSCGSTGSDVSKVVGGSRSSHMAAGQTELG